MQAPPAPLVLTEHRLVREVLRRPDFTVEHPFRATRQLFGPTAIDVDGPRRRRLRSHVTWFTPGRMPDWRRRVIDPAVAELVDALPEGEPVEFMTRIAATLPTRVLLRVLGLPARDAQWVWDRLVPITDHIETPGPPLAAVAARDELAAWVRDHLRAGPEPDGLLTLLKNSLTNPTPNPAPDPTSTPALDTDLDTAVRTALLLLAAGTRTTAAAAGNLIVTQLRRPDLWRAVRTGRLAPADVVRESLRWLTPLRRTVRFATADTTLDGTPIAQGAVVELDLAAANRDPAAFDHPDAFLPDRAGGPLMTFGTGPHACAGARLALDELASLLAALTHRFADATPAPGAAVTTSGAVFHQPRTLSLVLR
ncbi:cytochrome P450 (plasmid) [Streptomyces sp. BI20]|uniref:cytochrome P450 n=1 Tax=Streptomyces sp. BI20 TaxID=3403460 RepID=UPI003C71996A